MDSVLLPIPANRLDTVWAQVKPMLDSAVGSINGRMNISGVKKRLENNDWVLWVSVRNKVIEAIAITEILQYDLKKMCAVRVLTGHDYFNWVPLEEGIAAWAKSIGCHGMEAQARKGWAKIFKSYDFTHIFLERMF